VLHARYPDAELTFVLGADSLVRSRWQRLDDVVDRVAAIVVAPRGDVTRDEFERAIADLAPQRRTKIRLLDVPLVEESATLIRDRLRAQKSVRYLVPEPVFRYIAEHGLYAL
jgi:nicotinate-nucleotide adenylyltransferase